MSVSWFELPLNHNKFGFHSADWLITHRLNCSSYYREVPLKFSGQKARRRMNTGSDTGERSVGPCALEHCTLYEAPVNMNPIYYCNRLNSNSNILL